MLTREQHASIDAMWREIRERDERDRRELARIRRVAIELAITTDGAARMLAAGLVT